jgi:hypothetical protein
MSRPPNDWLVPEWLLPEWLPPEWLPPEWQRANTSVRILWMILLLMVREKRGNLILSLKGKSEISLKMDDTEMVPPPRYPFPVFVKLARQITRNNRSLEWFLTERNRTRKLKIIVNYANGDPAAQINTAMNRVLQVEEARRQARRADLRSRYTIAALIGLVFFLLMLVIVIQAIG